MLARPELDGVFDVGRVREESVNRIEELRHELARGAGATQARLDSIAAEMQPQKAALRPGDKDELLPLFDGQGKPTGMNAPRWICHVLGLRHCCADVLLIWRSPTMGDTLLLQIRSWDKDDSPGRLDISASGHMKVADPSSEATALAEMRQETNLSIDDLREKKLHSLGGYACDEPPRPAESFFNSEWREVYLAYVTDEGFRKIDFPDGEVAGVAIFPLKDAPRLLTQTSLPLASSLVHSLPVCLAHLNADRQTKDQSREP